MRVTASAMPSLTRDIEIIAFAVPPCAMGSAPMCCAPQFPGFDEKACRQLIFCPHASLNHCSSGRPQTEEAARTAGRADGDASMGQFCIDQKLGEALGGDTRKGLFFRGAGILPFGSEIRTVPELMQWLLGAIRPAAPTPETTT